MKEQRHQLTSMDLWVIKTRYGVWWLVDKCTCYISYLQRSTRAVWFSFQVGRSSSMWSMSSPSLDRKSRQKSRVLLLHSSAVADHSKPVKQPKYYLRDVLFIKNTKFISSNVRLKCFPACMCEDDFSLGRTAPLLTRIRSTSRGILVTKRGQRLRTICVKWFIIATSIDVSDSGVSGVSPPLRSSPVPNFLRPHHCQQEELT